MSFPAQTGMFRKWLRPLPKPGVVIVGLILTVPFLLGSAPASNTGSAPAVPNSTPPGADTGTAPTPAILPPALALLPNLTNPAVPAPDSKVDVPVRSLTAKLAVNFVETFLATNGLPQKGMSQEELEMHRIQRMEMARYLRTTRKNREAEALLTALLNDKSTELMQQSALLELAALARDDNDLMRAQQVYAQFLAKWPYDLRVPEIFLRQGLLFRQMGMYNLAFTKFYGVMTSALVMKNDQIDYYVNLVLQAQIEIAETQYELGKYADASEFFSRLLRQRNSSINISQIMYKLARCDIAQSKYAETVSEARDFLARFPDAVEQPEIRFYLALALKELGRNNESLQQVLLLLQEQRTRTRDNPAMWTYWQQRAGNLIANQLYQEGDYTKALEIYLNLSQLDPALRWQMPVSYQIGMTYERLWQPQKAAETYTGILAQEKELGTNDMPNLKTVLDMARWRLQFIEWQNKAESANRHFHGGSPSNSVVTASLSTTPSASHE
jgi:tetratricopeptide (TPR) repeat protein